MRRLFVRDFHGSLRSDLVSLGILIPQAVVQTSSCYWRINWAPSPCGNRRTDRRGYHRPSCPAWRRALFQATVRSAGPSSLPFVSGLKSAATRKIAKPTTVVTKIKSDRAIWWVVAYRMSSGEISPPQIAPWW